MSQPAVSREIESVAELSSFQKELFRQGDAGASETSLVASVRLRGALDLPAFRRAWRRVIVRHPVLRSSFHERAGGEALQVFWRRDRLEMTELDWSHLPHPAAERIAELACERRRSLVRSRPGVFSLTLVRLVAGETHLLVCFDRLLVDEASAEALLREVWTLYAGGSEASLPRALPYWEYVLWEQGSREEPWSGNGAALVGPLGRRSSSPSLFLPEATPPVWRVPAAPLLLTVDLRRLPATRREEVARRLHREESRRPFDLETGPLFRAVLVEIGDGESLLGLCMHHIVSDGYSMGLLIREMSQGYAALSAGREPSFAELPLRYGDFAAWQRRWLRSDACRRELDYWRGRLGEGTPILELPCDRPRPPVMTYRGERRSRALPVPLVEALRHLSRRQGVTLFMTLLAAFKVLLSRYSGQRDLVVGSPIANRHRRPVEGLVGCFVNTLALRTDLRGDPTFAELLPRVREVCLGAYQHQDLPFEKLIAELQPERDPSRTPLFQVLFVLQDALVPKIELPELTLAPLQLDNETAKLDLTLDIDTEGALEGAAPRVVAEYNTDLLDATTAERILRHYLSLLEAFGTAVEGRVERVSFLSAAEVHQLLVEAVPAAGCDPGGQSLGELFASQATRRGDAVALIEGSRRWTYAELNARANRLAHRLRQLGVGPESWVGLFCERSCEMVSAIVAVVKAGGAYVPLDPSYPEERLAVLLDDARLSVLVVSEEALDRLPAGAREVPRVGLKDDLSGMSREDPPPVAHPDNLAYVIYTSGSTGRPKGTLVTHRNVVRLLRATEAWFGFGEDDVWTLFHSYAFDFSVWEVWGALAYGGRLVVVPYWVSRAPASFHELLRDTGVTILNQTPSAFRQLIAADAEQGTPPLALRRVVLGGEAVDVGSLAPWLRRRPEARVVNMYGITETTVHVTYRPLGEADLERPHRSPLGRPIPDLGTYLLDRHRQAVPYAVRGEIHVAGAGLARGYHRRPAWTAERFVPDPWSGVPGARMYASGDLGRRVSTGEVEYQGRRDHQVKVRGFRIELGEIEAALGSSPEVREAVVLTTGGAASQRLTAWVVAESGEAPTAGSLRSFLGRSLPEYMIPSSFVPVALIPTTAHGKVDREALHRLASEQATLRPEEAYAAPRNEAERLLAGLWEEVLGVRRVGVHDNFFELGGDSILSLQIVARAGQAGLGLEPRHLFQHQTVAALATVARRIEAAPEPGEVTGPLPLTPIERWFFDIDPADLHHWNQAVVLELRQDVAPSVLRQAARSLLVHHDALRLRFSRGEAGWTQEIVADPGPEPFSVVDLTAVSEPEGALFRAMAAVQASLDLTAGPLARFVLFRRSGGAAPLLLAVIHHLAVDGVSWRILLEDLERLCLRAGLGRKTTSYKEWAERLCGPAAACEVELDFWRGTRPEDAPPFLTGGENRVADTDDVEVSLAPETTTALLREAHRAYRTEINDLLLTALALSWARCGGGRLRLDLERHGREDLFDGVDVSRTVGWFTSLFPVLLPGDLPQGDPGAAIRTVKEALRRIPRRGVGWGLLRYGDTPAADVLASLGAAEVSFNYLGQLDQVFAGSELFRESRQPFGSLYAPKGRRPHLLEVLASVLGGRLTARWRFNRRLEDRRSIEDLAGEWIRVLATLVEHCLDPESGRLTPSDVPEAGLDQEALDRLSAGIEDVYPLSPAQQGMLFFALINAEQRGLFANQMTLALTGDLDAARFQRTWRELLERHPMLRTAFVWEGVEAPLQGVREQVDLPWSEEDWRPLPEEEQEERLAALCTAERERGFELNAAPLQRFSLVRLGDERWRLIWTFHQLVLDGWSQSLVLSEALRRYEDPGADLGPRPRPYRDYIRWVRRQDAAAAESFWRRRLDGWSEPTPLRFARPAGAGAGEDGTGRRELRLRADLSGRLRALARRHRLTLNTLLQGAWALVLSRHCGTRDLLYGTVVSGRPPDLPGVESMVGLMINVLPVRVRTAGAQAVRDYFEKLQEEEVESRRYEHCPLEEIARWSGLPWDRLLFETLFVFENYPIADSLTEARQKLKIDAVEVEEQTNYPLTLFVVPGERLLFRVFFQQRRFAAETLEAMLGHFQAVLEGLLAGDLGGALGDLSLLGPAERRQILGEWSLAPRREAGGETTVTELFEAQCGRTPHAPAVVWDEGKLSLTYDELNRRANRLARLLSARGVGPEVRVGVYLERSPEMVVTVLAVLKAGGAYLPLDPGLPGERLAFLRDDAGASLTVSRRELPPELAGSRALFLDGESEELERRSAENPPVRALPENLAYVLYTSGSTGRPKGVQIPHAALLSYARDAVAAYGITPRDRVLQFASLSFDASAEEIFPCLMAGAALVLRDDAMLRSTADFLAACRDRRVTVLDLPTAWWHQVTADLTAEDLPPDVRLVILGGEEALAARVERWHAVTSETPVLVNSYGPTEATIVATRCEVRRGDDLTLGVPIGRPVAGFAAYVLDRDLAPVPPGVIGELYLGGAGLARGYVGRPGLSAERFLPDPFGATGERLYKSGDLARWLADGRLVFAGRGDGQVKVRGYRIELGEIEAVLARHEAVRQLAVVPREDKAGERRIVAYVVAAAEHANLPARLREHLAATLPDYMVPATFVLLEALPRNPAGKVDRWALPDPGRRRPDLTAGYVAPGNEIEEDLAEVFAEVLDVERVGTLDNFFELGGHSLLATQVVARLRELFEVELPLRALFEAPTVADLALVVEKVLIAELAELSDEEAAELL